MTLLRVAPTFLLLIGSCGGGVAKSPTHTVTERPSSDREVAAKAAERPGPHANDVAARFSALVRATGTIYFVTKGECLDWKVEIEGDTATLTRVFIRELREVGGEFQTEKHVSRRWIRFYENGVIALSPRHEEVLFVEEEGKWKEVHRIASTLLCGTTRKPEERAGVFYFGGNTFFPDRKTCEDRRSLKRTGC